ncbi:MAG: hypothetical protein EOM25_14650 [Deltaproteobacteria bacterium]|nr:hypothetical protein [Deltaproteobacteria bacterium]
MRKRLFAHLLGGSPYLILDNIVGTFDSPSLAAFLTAGEFSDRILGKSKTVALPNRTLTWLTGNNLTLAGDMPRRVLVAYIDPESETPFQREFDFCPLQYCLAHRRELVEAGVAVIMGYRANAKTRAKGRMASFETWDDLVRQPVAWLGREVQPGQWSDPMDSVVQAVSLDPERQSLGELLTSWRAVYGERAITAAELVKDLGGVGQFDDDKTNLAEAVKDLAGGAVLSSKGLGRVLTYRQGRIVDGLALAKAGRGKKAVQWSVRRIEGGLGV